VIRCLMPRCDTTAGCKCQTSWTVYATADETVPGLNDTQRRLNDALAQARAEGRIAGLEEAAKWHEARADFIMDSLHAGLSKEEYRESSMLADWHSNAADAIRAAKEVKS